MKINNNSSRNDIINNRQKDYDSISYTLLNMNANLNKGNFRARQEDAVLLLHHPLNNDFKLLAVADGMGGLQNGGKASNLALFEIINWFEKLSPEYYTKEKNIYLDLCDTLQYIDEKIRRICKMGGTTLSVAIISKNNTMLLNIGDSRIYIYDGNILNQISVDHSISWNMFVNGQIKEKDDIRFHRKNHLITSRLGGEKKMLIINNEIVENNDYKGIFLFTDGITDCLSDNELQKIINNNINNNVVDLIASFALNNTSKRINLDLTEYYDIVHGGKDNQTIATLIKRKEK